VQSRGDGACVESGDDRRDDLAFASRECIGAAEELDRLA